MIIKPALFGPRPITFRGNQTRQYPELYDKSQPRGHGSNPNYGFNPGRNNFDPFVKSVLKQFVPSGGNVLEVGCHTGNNLLEMAKDYHLFGLDLEQLSLDTIRKKGHQRSGLKPFDVAVWDIFEQGTLPPEWAEQNVKFNAVYAVQTFNHCDDQTFIRTMQQLKNHLQPGAVVIFTNYDDVGFTDPSKAVFGGSYPHSRDVLQHAFKGYRLLQTQPFRRDDDTYEGGLDYWSVKGFKEITDYLSDHLTWYVYQLPANQ